MLREVAAGAQQRREVPDPESLGWLPTGRFEGRRGDDGRREAAVKKYEGPWARCWSDSRRALRDPAAPRVLDAGTATSSSVSSDSDPLGAAFGALSSAD